VVRAELKEGTAVKSCLVAGMDLEVDLHSEAREDENASTCLWKVFRRCENIPRRDAKGR
jgi:hypothetical protein